MNMFRLWRRPSDFDVALAPVSMCVCSWMWMKEKQDVRHICCNNTASKNQICILWWLYTECWSPDHAAIQWLSFELKMIIVFFTIFYSSHPFNENEGNYLDKWCEQCSHIADTHTTGFCQGLFCYHMLNSQRTRIACAIYEATAMRSVKIKANLIDRFCLAGVMCSAWLAINKTNALVGCRAQIASIENTRQINRFAKYV